MFLIRCAGCKAKLFKYEKIGPGALLICLKERIKRVYTLEARDGKVSCPCGTEVGIDKGDHYRMIAGGFVASGQFTR